MMLIGLYDLVYKPLARVYHNRRLARHPTPRDRCLAEIEQTQWLSRREVADLQNAKLQKLLRHAYERVPYYRRAFRERGLTPGDVATTDDLARLPVLTKQMIQDHLDELLTEGIERSTLIENHTGGSTGHPLTFYQDQNYFAYGMADLHRCYRMCGYRFADRQAFLWGSDYDSLDHKGPRARARDLLRMNMIWVNTFDLTVESLTRFARILAWFKPEFIVAYVSSATMLAQLVSELGIRGIRPRAVQTSAEVLTPPQRELIETTFGCKAFDRYGCREVGNIAHECSEHSGLHILADNNFVEFLQDDRRVAPGETGIITVTNLNNFAMPMIRYQMDDLGSPTERECSCGRGLPLMDMVSGRTADVITTPSGKLLHGEFFTHLFYEMPGVRQFQVIQETRADLLVRIVPRDDFDAEAVKSLEEKIHRYGDPAFKIRVEMCDHIAPSRSGKFRFTISHVPLQFDS